MTPRENLKRAIEFRTPERLPISGYGEDVTDTIWITADDVPPPQADGAPGVDQWLCRWAYTEVPNMGQIKGHPLENLAALKDYPFPDANDPRRYTNVPARLAETMADPVKRGRYRITGIFMLLWERLQALHGFESTMIDIAEGNPAIHDLADRLTEYDIGIVRNMSRLCGAEIDTFNFSEDWGTETDLMISPKMFREFFLPRYKRIFAAAHDAGWHVWMHSCGKVNLAIPMLIEAGLDVLNLQQPLTNGIAEIGRQFAGKICFETLCDIQKTLPKGDRDEIRQQAEELMRSWGTPQGGFVLGDYGDERAIGADAGVKQYMLDCFCQLDPWKTGWNGHR